MFASRKPVTYLADYRKLHSKWQKWGESDNINQPFDYRTCKKLSKSNYLPWEAGEGLNVSWDTLNKGIGLIMRILSPSAEQTSPNL